MSFTKNIIYPIILTTSQLLTKPSYHFRAFPQWLLHFFSNKNVYIFKETYDDNKHFRSVRKFELLLFNISIYQLFIILILQEAVKQPFFFSQKYYFHPQNIHASCALL